ncbi:enoyl-CoA hydratase/isomerase family protein [Rhodococcus opacus]|uniref:enoyl-CoA hydratase/isomerase family protein n=1 Tax=Rhodococcus opacus TaxID=37919 RepID=UPI001C490BE4|nr:enoyl-CoA hydratase-related protein [Rhodococcus opacus]MBV6760231.1 enoyl-CoA hydratase/isomerase family protein [Rhodococcus opacus]
MIRSEMHDRSAVVTIDNERRHNALGADDLYALEREFQVLGAHDDVDAIIVTGAGEASFVAGGDISELSRPISVADAMDLPMQRIFRSIADCPKPTIAAVNGYALGGGFELALACDIRVASENAVFALPELSWSVLPAAGGVTRLTRLIGPGRALEAMLTGRRFTAQQTLDCGIVSAVVPVGEALSEAVTVASTIQDRGPIAVRVARMTVQLAAESSAHSGLIAETLGLALLYGTEDKAEGTTSFLEKRPAQFKGK